MYLLTITASLCAAYFILYALIPYFFTGSLVGMSRKSISSLAIIIVLSLLGHAVVLNISDLELGNRVLHAFGGGFLAFLVCFLVVRDSGISISRFQFFILSALIVTAMGVSNETLEYFLQNYGGMVFIRSTNDTWLDLISNSVGIIIASAALVSFSRNKKEII